MGDPAIAARREDMSPRGRLMLYKQTDGDIIVHVVADDDGDWQEASVEFCTQFGGGGRSPHTWQALRTLFEAMQKDNEETPIPDREPLEIPKSRRMGVRQFLAEIERLSLLQEKTLIALGRATYQPSIEEVSLADDGTVPIPSQVKTDAEWVALGLIALDKDTHAK
jgi:hypothetical protein